MICQCSCVLVIRILVCFKAVTLASKVSNKQCTVPTSRQLEDAADALARLDLACVVAPRAFSTALRFAAVSALAGSASQGTRALAAAFDASRAARDLTPALRRWLGFVDEEERRSRGGAPLTFARLERSGVLSTGGTDRIDDATVRVDREAMIERALRAPPTPRPAALHRALDVAAAIGEWTAGEAAAAIMLCAEGRTDRVRILPFGEVTGEERDEATARWRDGEEAAWSTMALEALVATARARRLALDRALASQFDEDASLDGLGRAAITARRALGLLRDELSTTVPQLAAELELSRPASDDALARLVELGIATETTGRRRDRVFAYAAALAITE